ncbi:MAG: HAD-IC family P-type ATPase, partial [Legionellaceae bacterium]|nr:HAD-IC family P-type ATPase [Legionellaceae bacterium]
MFQTYTFNLEGVKCSNCLTPLTTQLDHEKKTKHIMGYHIQLGNKQLKVYVDDDTSLAEKDIHAWIQKSGLSCAPIKTQKKRWWQRFTSNQFQGIAGTLIGLTILLVGVFVPVLPFGIMLFINIFSTIGVLLLGAPSYYSAYKKWMMHRQLTMDTLFAFSSFFLLLISWLSLGFLGLPMLWDAAWLLFAGRHLGLSIRNNVIKKLGVDANIQETPLSTEVEIQDAQQQWKKIPLSQVKKGDLIRCPTKTVIPVDGICKNTTPVSVIQTCFDGSTLPREVLSGEKVWSGSTIHEGTLLLEVTHLPQDSYLSVFEKSIAQASANKAPIQLKAERILRYFIPAALLFAVFIGILVGCLTNPLFGVLVSIGFIVSICPCITTLIPSLAVRGALKKAHHQEIYFTKESAIEAASQIKMAVFDLNGTLTTGVPEVTEMHYRENTANITAIKARFSAMESKIDHPIAQAIMRFFSVDALPDLPKQDIQKIEHHGYQAVIEGETYVIGNLKTMQALGIDVQSLTKKSSASSGQHQIFLAQRAAAADSPWVPLAMAVLRDPVRKDAKKTIALCREKNIKVKILTGAPIETALCYLNDLGVSKEDIHANCDGLQKTAFMVKNNTPNNPIAMIGDADNDKGAMKASHMSVAIDSDFSNWNLDSEDRPSVYIPHKRLLPLIHIFNIGKETVKHIQQNLWFSLSYNFCITALILTLALVGIVLNPGFGVLFMVLQTVIVLANTYRIQTRALPKITNDTELPPS